MNRSYHPPLTFSLLAFPVVLGLVLFNGLLQAQEPVDDRELREYFSEKLEEMIADKKVVNPAKLWDQIEERTNGAPVKISLPSSATTELSRAGLYKRCDDSVVLVGRFYKCGHCPKWHISIAGAAAITRNGLFVTNHHVLERDDREVGAIGIMTRDRRVFSVSEILAANIEDDLAVFRVKGARVRPLPLGANPDVGETVHAIHHPGGRLFTYTEGVVSRHFISREEEHQRAHRMAVTADYARGSSGAPILDARGNLVGLISSTNTLGYPNKNQKVKGEITQMVVKSTIPVSSLYKLLGVPVP